MIALSLVSMLAAAGFEPLLKEHARLVAPDGAGFEIVAYASTTNELWATRSDRPRLARIDLSDPDAPILLEHVSLERFGIEVTSVATSSDLVAATVLASPTTDTGTLIIMNLDGSVRSWHSTGSHPDMVTFSPNGALVFVANEGEPADGVDPPGSITVYQLAGGHPINTWSSTLGDPDTAADDVTWTTPLAETAPSMVEPEYIAVSPGGLAAVAAQENNGIALVDTTSWPPRLTAELDLGVIGPKLLGLVDTRDDGQLRPQPATVAALPQPDAIAVVDTAEGPVIFTADEGDPRDDWGRDGAAKLDGLERAKLQTQSGIPLIFGARGISAWRPDGSLITRAASPITTWAPSQHNADYETILDKRSDRRGEEPEGLVAWRDGERTLVAAGFERAGALGLFEYRDETLHTLDIVRIGETKNAIASPEGIAVFEHSGRTFLAVADEAGGSITLLEVHDDRRKALKSDRDQSRETLSQQNR
ncbi:MAG: hypothetical protein AAFR76_15345 [Planctomycetota bacterium]